MKVVHNKINVGTADKTSFILTNKKGEFLFLPSYDATTRYQGVYYLNQGMFKIIDNIKLLLHEPDAVHNNFSNYERHYFNSVERFHLLDNGLVYEVENFTGMAELTLDMRKIFDFSTEGRIHRIHKENDLLIIEYTKYKDNTLAAEDYRIYLAIKGLKDYQLKDEWEKRFYGYDYVRGSHPFEFYIYRALKFGIGGNAKLCFAWGSKEEAILKVNGLINDVPASVELSPKLCIAERELNLAYLCSKNAVLSMHHKDGLYAGLPWFFQEWVRDEEISIGALIKEGMIDEAKAIIFKHLGHIKDGVITNFLGESELLSADGVGWIFKRASEIIDNCTMQEKKRITTTLKKTIQELLEKHTIDGFAVNKPLETWMDTSYGNDTRQGARIEIQAMRLYLYKFMSDLSPKEEKYYHSLEMGLKSKVKENFFKDGILIDGLGDGNVRPNIFIAYYIYPWLLEPHEWEEAFDNALLKLWCEYGAISSISFESDLYHAEYTGEDNKSYHRGDSWFFLNHLSAICLLRLNRTKYKEVIHKIIEASTHEILKMGVIGYNAEISSALELRSEGCEAQTWSSSTFIELCHELLHD